MISLSHLKSFKFPQNPIWVFKASLNGFPTDFLGHHSPLHVPSLWSIRSTWPHVDTSPALSRITPSASNFLSLLSAWQKSADASNSGSNVTSSWELPHWNKLISLYDAESHSFCYPCQTAYSWRAESFLKFAISSPRTVPDTRPWCSTEWNRILFQESYKGVGVTILSRN